MKAKLAENALAGVIVIFLLIGAGFSANVFVAVIAVAICCVIGALLSFVSYKVTKTHFWLYGLAYISFPILFIYSSGNDTKTTEMRLIWTGVLSVIYVVSLIGGIIARKSIRNE